MRNINDIYNSTSVALIKQQQQKSDNFKKMQNIVILYWISLKKRFLNSTVVSYKVRRLFNELY